MSAYNYSLLNVEFYPKMKTRLYVHIYAKYKIQ